MGSTPNYDHKNKKQLDMENKVLNLLSIHNPHNINLPYEHIFHIVKKSHTGKGFKNTYSYISKIDKQLLDEQRQIFWETRISANPIWSDIREILQFDNVNQIKEILHKKQLCALGGSLQIILDKKKQIYQVPIFIINDPISYQRVVEKEQEMKRDSVLNIEFRFENKKLQAEFDGNAKAIELTDYALNYLITENLIDLDVQSIKLIHQGQKLIPFQQISQQLKKPYIVQIFLTNNQFENEIK